MQTFLDIQEQTTYKMPMKRELKEYINNSKLHDRITQRGHVEQIMAKLHPAYKNAGKRLTRFSKHNTYDIINSLTRMQG